MAQHPTSVSIEERRRFPRSEFPPRVAISLLHPNGPILANSVNMSEGGLCFRVEETIEVRSLVRLQLTLEGLGSTRGQRPVECAGRVAWVIQRLDLRPSPPFLFDVGIQFVDPPPMLRQLMVQQGRTLGMLKGRSARDHEKALEPAVIRGRQFVPRLTRQANQPSRWHLIVTVDGAPCFSGRYASRRTATAAWTRFKRERGKR